MQYEDGDDEVVYERKRSNGKPGAEERFEPLDLHKVIKKILGHLAPGASPGPLVFQGLLGRKNALIVGSTTWSPSAQGGGSQHGMVL